MQNNTLAKNKKYIIPSVLALTLFGLFAGMQIYFSSKLRSMLPSFLSAEQIDIAFFSGTVQVNGLKLKGPCAEKISGEARFGLINYNLSEQRIYEIRMKDIKVKTAVPASEAINCLARQSVSMSGKENNENENSDDSTSIAPPSIILENGQFSLPAEDIVINLDKFSVLQEIQSDGKPSYNVRLKAGDDKKRDYQFSLNSVEGTPIVFNASLSIKWDEPTEVLAFLNERVPLGLGGSSVELAFEAYPKDEANLIQVNTAIFIKDLTAVKSLSAKTDQEGYTLFSSSSAVNFKYGQNRIFEQIERSIVQSIK